MATVKVTPDMVAQALREVDWAAQDAMTDDDIARQVAEDPEVAPLLTDAQLTAVHTSSVRQRSGLSQSEFAHRYRIPLDTLRDWERGEREPDAAALAYLRVIDREPAAVDRALSAFTPA